MTRRWVKEELKKNPLERFVIKLVEFVSKNKNEVITAAAALVVIGLFIGVMIRQRIQSNIEAGRIFASAQADFQSFRYNEAIEKFKRIREEHSGARIVGMASYMKGLAYVMMEDYENAAYVLKQALEKYPGSGVRNHIYISLAKTYEEMELYDQALYKYSQIEEEDYLYPEALLGKAAAYESAGQTDSAVEIYRRINVAYPHYFWGEISLARLEVLGEPVALPDTALQTPLRSDEAEPEIDMFPVPGEEPPDELELE